MQIIAQAVSAAPITVTGAASTTSASVSYFNVIAGEPGAGSQLLLSAPGTNRLNGQPFKVRSAGYTTLAAGTYTTSITILTGVSKTAGFTAAASNSLILTTTTVPVTLSSASAVSYPWSLDIQLEGDSTSGVLSGTLFGQINNGASIGFPTTGANATWNQITNSPSTINFATEPPFQFAFGVQVGTTSNTFPVSNAVSTLTNAVIEA
jgi:hypothetical protein